VSRKQFLSSANCASLAPVQFHPLCGGSKMETKFNRLSSATQWIDKLLQHIGAKTEPTLINVSEHSAEIAFTRDGQRWKVILKEEEAKQGNQLLQGRLN
jgi:hypothetical protein